MMQQRLVFETSSGDWGSQGAVSFDLAIFGKVVDERGRASADFLKSASSGFLYLYFDPNSQSVFSSEDAVIELSALRALLTICRRVVLDATTLGVGEILHVLAAVKAVGGSEVEFFYVEPKQYAKAPAVSSATMSREFRLTENCRFIGVQGFIHEYRGADEAHHVFLIGFEPGRLRNALEQREVELDRYCLYAIAGVPAFQFGWESNSLHTHARAFEEIKIGRSRLSYCDASSIREAYLSLWELYSAVGSEEACFYVSPLGTKPHAVAAALFLVETKGAACKTSLFYDHPVRVDGRSVEMGRWHHVRVNGLSAA